MNPRLKKYFEKWRKEVDRALHQLLPKESQEPRIIHKAMRYSIFAGGKRLRPILTVAAAEACGLSGRNVLPQACALEMIHTYSLIHDDLPAMDDDDLRRGRPTSHKVFGEAIAILAGDALLTHAFKLASKNGKIPSFAIPKAVEAIAVGAGTEGMVGGQVMDIEMEGGKWKKIHPKRRGAVLRTIHENKTAALITASLLSGALLAQARARQLKSLKEYGTALGLAFQVADDILDVTADKKLLGKKGSDAANKKLTYASLYGLEKARRMARELSDRAKRSLKIFGKRGWVLNDLADYVVERAY